MPSTRTDRIDGLSTSLAVKAPVKTVALVQTTLSGTQTVNGVAVAVGDRVLVTAQSDPIENGIYDVKSGAWSRSGDFDGARDVVKGTLVVSNTGTTIYYRVTTPDPIRIGESQISFEVVSGAIPQTFVANVRIFGAVGDGVTNDTAAIQAAIDSMSSGGTVYFPPGDYLCSSGLTVSNNDVHLVGAGGASLTYTTPTQILLTISGDRVKMRDLNIDAPDTIDATNAAIGYSIVKVEGEHFSADGCSINNIPRVGIWFSECNNGSVTNCRIDGGMPEGDHVATNTVHFGVLIDPPSTGSQGNFILSGNIIRQCVQGAGSGNTGAASLEQSIVVSGNVFELCWDHGYYTSGQGNGVTVNGNSFNACRIPIALTGGYHTVVGNTLIVFTTGTGDDDGVEDNEITGISLREPINCVVANNTIRGEGTPTGAVISLEDTPSSLANKVENNIVTGNVIEITNPTVAGVSAIRLLSQPTTNVSNNIVSSNVIIAPIRALDGLIVVLGNGTALSESNSVVDNQIIVNGCRGAGGFAILCVGVSDSDVTNNKIRVVYDAGSAQVVAAVELEACTRVRVQNNQIRCTAAWGDNVEIRGVQETTSGSGNEVIGNSFTVNTTKATALLFNLLSTSGVRVEHAGPGTPESAVMSAIGGLWRRTDGSTGTTLYVKEAGTNNEGWEEK